MKLPRFAAAIVVVATAQLFCQVAPPAQGPANAPPSPASPFSRPPRMPAAARGAASGVPTPISLRQREDEMEVTVTKMHAALEQMRKKATLSKDPAVKANLELWSLMLDHLQEELKDLKVNIAVRDDMEARRAAMYKQADAKAQAAAQEAVRKKFDQSAPQPDGSAQPTQPPASQTSPASAPGTDSNPK